MSGRGVLDGFAHVLDNCGNKLLLVTGECITVPEGEKFAVFVVLDQGNCSMHSCRYFEPRTFSCLTETCERVTQAEAPAQIRQTTQRLCVARFVFWNRGTIPHRVKPQ